MKFSYPHHIKSAQQIIALWNENDGVVASFFALLLLLTASGDVTEGYAATGVDPQHIAQLDELVEARRPVGVLPVGHSLGTT